MKKTHLIIAALAAITMVPVHAETLKEKAVQRFNTSIDRFRTCIRGKCTGREALKLSRNVAITAAAVIAVMYGIGAGLKRGAIKGSISRERAGTAYRAGLQLQRPGVPFVRAGTKAAEAAEEAAGAAADWLEGNDETGYQAPKVKRTGSGEYEIK
ncbi:hypothetical protein E3J61_00675 [Candidatus Dependentiae bacterium]|nr:MAG: hypothetical protein E3J61_00675 [Candidatus Dependentiae bacterium]